MRLVLLIGLAAALPGLAAADYCEERADAGLSELSGVLQASADGSSANTARDVLVRVCRDAQGSASGGATATWDSQAAPASAAAPATAPAAPEAKAEGESTKLFGIEIKEAPEGAAGYERARKVP